MTNYKHYYLVGEYKHIAALDNIMQRRFYPVLKTRKPKNYLLDIIAENYEEAEFFLTQNNIVRRVNGYLVFDIGLINSYLGLNIAR